MFEMKERRKQLDLGRMITYNLAQHNEICMLLDVLDGSALSCETDNRNIHALDRVIKALTHHMNFEELIMCHLNYLHEAVHVNDHSLIRTIICSCSNSSVNNLSMLTIIEYYIALSRRYRDHALLYDVPLFNICDVAKHL